jgi:hypothetical protein
MLIKTLQLCYKSGTVQNKRLTGLKFLKAGHCFLLLAHAEENYSGDKDVTSRMREILCTTFSHGNCSETLHSG